MSNIGNLNKRIKKRGGGGELERDLEKKRIKRIEILKHGGHGPAVRKDGIGNTRQLDASAESHLLRILRISNNQSP